MSRVFSLCSRLYFSFTYSQNCPKKHENKSKGWPESTKNTLFICWCLVAIKNRHVVCALNIRALFRGLCSAWSGVIVCKMSNVSEWLYCYSCCIFLFLFRRISICLSRNDAETYFLVVINRLWFLAFAAIEDCAHCPATHWRACVRVDGRAGSFSFSAKTKMMKNVISVGMGFMKYGIFCF